MRMAHHRATRSERPSRQKGLTRQRVVEEAIVLIDRAGLEAFTMRRLATRLGVSPMALYNHVRDKQDLLQGVAMLLLSDVDFSSEDRDWRERIRTAFRQLRTVCLAHPGAVPVMEAVEVVPLAMFGLLEATAAALAEAGLSPEDALRAYTLLTNFTLGQVSYELRGPFHALDPAEARHRWRFAETGYPHVARAAIAAEHWDFDAAFEFGLSVILSGLERGPAT